MIHGSPEYVAAQDELIERHACEINALMNHTLSVDVHRRSHDYHACVSGKPHYWGRGISADAAVGDLVKGHPGVFRVTIKCD